MQGWECCSWQKSTLAFPKTSQKVTRKLSSHRRRKGPCKYKQKHITIGINLRADLFTPGILCAKEKGGSHRQNKLKGDSSLLWFVGLWCVLASQMLLIHGIYMGLSEIHIQKGPYIYWEILDTKPHPDQEVLRAISHWRKRGQQKASVTHLLGFHLWASTIANDYFF